ncbi:nucleolar RNA helicase II [Trypanosoma cruzi]|uniref:Nucleolar RNA helicase II n=1 Tax=Trypanosoma cruzi TaxID=5693 RepID=A0A7J6XY76_TRYCR|nr:nucleolar RNA helicase II [Trypanosoma cruzi]
MGVHAYIQWAHYVCASWDEVRARVHARGHTQRVSEGRVCAGGAWLSLPHSHAATAAAAAAAHATKRRSKRGEVVWETAVLPSLFCVFVVSVVLAVTVVAFVSSPVPSEPLSRWLCGVAAVSGDGTFFSPSLMVSSPSCSRELTPSSGGGGGIPPAMPPGSLFSPLTVVSGFSTADGFLPVSFFFSNSGCEGLAFDSRLPEGEMSPAGAIDWFFS